MQKQNLCQGDFMPKNRQHYRKIKYPDKVTKQNALYLSGYFYLVLWEVEMLISRQPLPILKLSISEQLLFRFIIYFLRSVLSFGSTTFNSTAMIVATTTGLFPKIVVNSFGNAASAP